MGELSHKEKQRRKSHVMAEGKLVEMGELVNDGGRLLTVGKLSNSGGSWI